MEMSRLRGFEVMDFETGKSLQTVMVPASVTDQNVVSLVCQSGV